MKTIFETERLILREFVEDDAPFIIELLNSPGWIEFIGDRNVKTEEQAIAYLQNGPMKSYKVNGFGLCCVVMKEGAESIGMCGIIRRENLKHPDIGFAFLPEFTGKGYAFEAANATMEYAKDSLKLSPIYAITIPNNIHSIMLLEKIGMHFVKPFYFPNDEEELMLYSS